MLSSTLELFRMWIWDANNHAVPLCLAILPFERLSRSNIVATDLYTRDTQRRLNTNTL
jgi:hypothetical protein